MKPYHCPDPITWQAVIDGEEDRNEYQQHLESCVHCQQTYQEIQGDVGLADELFTGVTIPKDLAQRLLHEARPFPAGLLAAVLFALLIISVTILDPGIFYWWLTVGLTVWCGILIDIVLEIMKTAQRMTAGWWLTLAAVVAALEMFLLTKLNPQSWDENPGD